MWILSTRDALDEVVGSVEQPVALLPAGDRFDELDWLLWALDRVSPGVAARFAPLGVSRDGRSLLYEVPPEVASALAHDRHADMRELAAAWTQDEEWLARAWSWWRNLRELCVRARDTGRQVFGMGGPAGGHTSPPPAESYVEWYASIAVFLRLRDRERSARIWLGAARGNDYDSCLHDLNRFIAGSGRQFVMACDGWGYFACLTPEERALLHERGVRFSGLPASDPSLAPPVKSGR